MSFHIEATRRGSLALHAWRAGDYATLKRIRGTRPSEPVVADLPKRAGKTGSILLIAKQWKLAGSELYAKRFAYGLGLDRVDLMTTRDFANKTLPQLWEYDAILPVYEAMTQVITRLYGYGTFGPRIIGMINTSPSDGDLSRVGDLLLANTACEAKPEQSVGPVVVLHPPVDPRFYDLLVEGPPRSGPIEGVLQVNLSTIHKNPVIFSKLAAAFASDQENPAPALPPVTFYAVKGTWGEQLVPVGRSNVLAYESGPDAVYDMFASGKNLLVIVPSTKETYGILAAEAAAAGLPVLISDLPGPREIGLEDSSYVAQPTIEGWLPAVTKAVGTVPDWAGLATAAGRLMARQRCEEKVAEDAYWAVVARREG